MKIISNQNSIKIKLFASISCLIILTLIIVTVIAFIVTKHEVEEVFDANLVKSAKLYLGLVKHEIYNHEQNNSSIVLDLGKRNNTYGKYEHKILSQIWIKDQLMYNSLVDLNVTKPDYYGFNYLVINNKKRRSFVIFDSETKITVQIIEKDGMRRELIWQILATLFFPLTISFIPILFIIWITINKGLEPLTKILKEIEKISSTNLTAIKKERDLPKEITPLIDSINSLLKRLTESLESEKRFVDYAAHELRTPLSAIKTQTQLLVKKNRKNKDQELQNDLNFLVEAIERIIHLANQLLILSGIDPENIAAEKEKINVKFLLEEVLAKYYKVAAKRKIRFKIKTENCLLLMNKTYLEIVFSNLIDNAIKYGNYGGVIEINLQQKQHKIIFDIRNEGKTIKKSDLKKVFDKFYRVKEVDSAGSGLGLAIVKKIVDLFDGKIEFSSKNNINDLRLVFLS